MSEDPTKRSDPDEPETDEADGSEGPTASGRERADDVAEKLKEEEGAAE
jgi:hypothetical protein